MFNKDEGFSELSNIQSAGFSVNDRAPRQPAACDPTEHRERQHEFDPAALLLVECARCPAEAPKFDPIEEKAQNTYPIRQERTSRTHDSEAIRQSASPTVPNLLKDVDSRVSTPGTQDERKAPAAGEFGLSQCAYPAREALNGLPKKEAECFWAQPTFARKKAIVFVASESEYWSRLKRNQQEHPDVESSDTHDLPTRADSGRA